MKETTPRSFDSGCSHLSYLQRPRLHFYGQFETDVPTVNNIGGNYDPARFQPRDLDRTSDKTLGSWNAYGTGSFRLVDCGVTSAWGRDGRVTGDDAVLKMQLADRGDRVPAKLVDLDSASQGVSQIWGLRLRLVTSEGLIGLSGRYLVAAFTDDWPRRQTTPIVSTGIAAVYQSQLCEVEWPRDLGASPFLRQLREAAGDGPLSIRFVVDQFNEDYNSDGFRLGRLCGSLGVATKEEPRHFVRGRQLFSAAMGPANPAFPYFPPATFGNAVAVVDADAGKVIVDLGNAVPTQAEDMSIVPMRLELGTGPIGNFASLGSVDCNPNWYVETAGVAEFPPDGRLTDAQIAMLQTTPLAIAGPTANGLGILATETASGEHLRADDIFFRLSPGDDRPVQLYASRYGQPLPNAAVICDFDDSLFSNKDGDPPPGVPREALRPAPSPAMFPTQLTTDRNGIAVLHLVAGSPGHRRVYIDGQVYAVRPLLQAQVNKTAPINRSDVLSILVFDEVEIPARPTWYIHVRPILTQYANLYPVMRQVLDLDDYESVVAHKDMLKRVFSLDPEDPNYMPVTRDLSPKKRKLLLDWLSAKGEPALGHEPPLGIVPPPAPTITAPPVPAPFPPAAGVLAQDGSKAEALSRTKRFGGKG